MKKYLLVYGNRRLEACKKIGWKTIPAKVGNEVKQINIKDIEVLENIRTDQSDVAGLLGDIQNRGLLQAVGVVTAGAFDRKEFVLTNTAENIHRKNISPIELGRICLRLNKEMEMTASEIANKLNIPKQRVETSLQLFRDVPEKHRNSIGYIKAEELQHKKGKISASVANAISNLRTTKANKEILFDESKKEELTTRDIKTIRHLIENGATAAVACKSKDKYCYYSLNLALKKNILDQLQVQYPQLTKGKLIISMLKGEIPLKTELFFFKP